MFDALNEEPGSAPVNRPRPPLAVRMRPRTLDELVGQQQVVVKNLEANYRKVAGISGATIMGDGGVALILDVAALVRSSRQLADDPVVQ